MDFKKRLSCDSWKDSFTVEITCKHLLTYDKALPAYFGEVGTQCGK